MDTLTQNFSDYKIAHISTNEESKIKDLEQTISSEVNKKIVLIAYETKSEE